ncbi:MAG: hypothetical protein R2873_31195 [Caldilineaceae bacterium]
MLESAVDHAYAAALEEWRTQRIAELRRPDGWLSLAGLFWLSAGRSSFGSAPDNDIIFPADKAAPVIGTLSSKMGRCAPKFGRVLMCFTTRKPVAHLTLADDKSKSPTILTHRSLSWLVIRHDDQIGIRLRRQRKPRLTSFDGVPSFPVDPSWRWRL